MVFLLGTGNDKVEHLMGYFGPEGTVYDHVMDLLEGEPIDHPALEQLLVHIETTWKKEKGNPEEYSRNSQCHVLSTLHFYNLLMLLLRAQ